MLVQAYRPVIAAAWLFIFGLVTLMWSSLSAATGIVLLLVGLAGPAVMLIEWRDRALTVARVAPRAKRSARP